MDDDAMLDCDDFEKTLKVCVVGNGNVGKTSLTTRYAKGRFTENYKKTIGVDFMERVVRIDGEDIHLMIWDTAGQEEFDTLTSRYYRGAGAVVYVFSTVDRDSFDALPSWQQKVKDQCGNICQVLVQNKIDLIDEAVMSKAEVEDMKEQMRVRLYRTSVQENKNVEEVFEYLCRRYLKKKAGDDGIAPVSDIGTLTSPPQETKSSRKKKTEVHRASSNPIDEEEDADDAPKRARQKSTPKITKAKQSEDTTSFDDIRVAVPSNEAGEMIDQFDREVAPQEVLQGPPRSAIEPSKRRTNGKKKRGCIIS